MKKLQKTAKSSGWLLNHLISMTGCSARHGKPLKVKKGDKITVTVRSKSDSQK